MNDYIYSEQNQTSCLQVEGAEWVPKYVWRVVPPPSSFVTPPYSQGRWLPGQPRPAKWMTDAFIPRWAWNNTFDLIGLKDAYVEAVDVPSISLYFSTLISSLSRALSLSLSRSLFPPLTCSHSSHSIVSLSPTAFIASLSLAYMM